VRAYCITVGCGVVPGRRTKSRLLMGPLRPGGIGHLHGDWYRVMGTESEYFEVNRDWIRRHRTERGGWTQQALAVLGVAWPPPRGWIERSIGLQLTAQERALFEARGRLRGSRSGDLFEH
jgi:hypothetical protein